MTRQSGQTCTSAIPPHKRLVDNTLQLDGLLCLNLSVGKASVMIFIEELACSKNCVLRLPLILTARKRKIKKSQLIFTQILYWRWQLPVADCLGDESKVHHFEPDSNQQPMEWLHRVSLGENKLKSVMWTGRDICTDFGWNIYYSFKFLDGGTTVDFQLYAKTIASLDARLRPLGLTEICRKYCPYRTRLASTEFRAVQKPPKILDGQWYCVSPRVVTSYLHITTCLSF